MMIIKSKTTIIRIIKNTKIYVETQCGKNYEWHELTIHYVKEYEIDIRILIRDYNSQTLSHKTGKKRNRIYKVFLLLVC